MREDLIRPGERVDDLQRDGLVLLQDPEKFCFGMDAVLLSAFAQIRRGDRVLDLCTGNGILPILLSARTEAAFLTGVEIQPEAADMAKRSVLLNGLSEKVRILEGDIRRIRELLPGEKFDAVTCNPPYMGKGDGIPNPDPARAMARHEITCTVFDAAQAAAAVLKDGGRFFMVHRPHRLGDAAEALKKSGLGLKRATFVHPTAGKSANLMLLEAVFGGRDYVRVEPPLILYREDGSYTEEIRKIYGYGE